jgi:hypothetical protein
VNAADVPADAEYLLLGLDVNGVPLRRNSGGACFPYCERVKFTSTSVTTSTGWPFSSVGR